MSTWEALTLHHKGRMYLADNLKEWVATATRGTREAAFTHGIVLTARELDLHQDAADRMLVATAQVLDLTLVTADQQLLGAPGIRTLANR